MTAIYQVRLRQVSEKAGTTFNNVFYYRPSDGVGPPDGATGMSVAFQTGLVADGNGVLQSLLSLINAVQVVDVRNAFIESVSLFNPLDFAITPLSGGGTFGDNASSYTDAIRFRTARVRRDIRRGQKRFAGVPETRANEGALRGDAGYFEVLELLRQALGTPITFDALSGTLTVVPVVVKRVRVDGPDGKVSYRLPALEAELGDNFFDATAWETDFTVSTQNSRRRPPSTVPVT